MHSSAARSIMRTAAILLVSGFIAIVLAADGKVRAATPKCMCNGLACECCAGFTFRKQEKSACIRTNYNAQELILNLEVVLDGNVIANRVIGPDFVPFCVPAPPLLVCVNARKVYLSKDEAKICAGYDIKAGPASVFKGRLPCLTMVGGQFTVTKN